MCSYCAAFWANVKLEMEKQCITAVMLSQRADVPIDMERCTSYVLREKIRSVLGVKVMEE